MAAAAVVAAANLHGAMVEMADTTLPKNLAKALDQRGDQGMVLLVIDVHAPFREVESENGSRPDWFDQPAIVCQ